MSTRQMLMDSAEKIFSDHCDKPLLDRAEIGEFPLELWEILESNGFHDLAATDNGLELAEAFAVFKVAGRHALPLPLVEVVLANRWLGNAEQFVSVGVVDGNAVHQVPWGRNCDAVIGVDTNGTCTVLTDCEVTPSTNAAGEPRDLVVSSTARRLESTDACFEMLALGRVVQMAGALERMLDFALQYAMEREQFGRPIAKFQAIQHNLALMAAEVAAAGKAADAAVDACGDHRFVYEVAAAKARTGEAAGICAEIAHQVHGAMGFTHEHQLHHFTRRVWAWRDELGNETFWRRRLGEHVAELGADSAWDFIATRG